MEHYLKDLPSMLKTEVHSTKLSEA